MRQEPDPDAELPWVATGYVAGPDLRRTVGEVGPLPVRPATVLAAKATAVTGAGVIVAVALNVLPALLFPIVVLLKAPVGLGDVVRGIAAHFAAGLAVAR